MTSQGAARVQLENELRLALARRELEVHFQPQVVLANRGIGGVEALMRWPHRHRGWISSDEFIPIAEDSNLIHPLGEFALARGCRQIVEWEQAGLPPVRLAIKVSARQFWSVGFARTVEVTLLLADLEPDRLELELTGGAIVESPDRALVILKKLRGLGLRIAIDDYGGPLTQMPVDCLKVHRSFVRRFAEKGLQAGIAGAIIALARTHGLRVVAEGVDTVEQLDFAVSHGCDEAQGDVFCPPLPADALAPLLASGIVSGPWPAS